MTATMDAIQLQSPGGPEVLDLVRLPWPVPRPHEVLVRAHAIGAGGPDVLIRNGTYKWMPPMPAIPGNELAGTIEAVGSDVQNLKIGQRVLVSSRELAQRGGCYAQAICVPGEAPFSLPDPIGFDEAVSLGNFQLALALLASNGNLPVQSILVPGAAGGVASALTQVARARGIRVIGTVSSDEKRAYALANGTHDILDSEPHALAEKVMQLTDDRGVDMAFDHIGGALFIACLKSLASSGMAVSYNIVSGHPEGDVFSEMRKLLGRSLAIRTFSIHAIDADPQQRRGLMQTAIDLMASGAVRPPVISCFPLSEAQHVHRLLDAGSTLGKIVLKP